jgi:hypothetical protein
VYAVARSSSSWELIRTFREIGMRAGRAAAYEAGPGYGNPMHAHICGRVFEGVVSCWIIHGMKEDADTMARECIWAMETLAESFADRRRGD